MLAAYVAVDAIQTLTGTGEATSSLPGIVLAALSVAVMEKILDLLLGRLAERGMVTARPAGRRATHPPPVPPPHQPALPQP